MTIHVRFWPKLLFIDFIQLWDLTLARISFIIWAWNLQEMLAGKWARIWLLNREADVPDLNRINEFAIMSMNSLFIRCFNLMPLE